MIDEPDNIVLAILRKIDLRTERMAEDIHDLKTRVMSIEEGLAGVNRRLDRLEDRVDRIEKRLELSDVTH
jgi:archaellum component FlaC